MSQVKEFLFKAVIHCQCNFTLRTTEMFFTDYLPVFFFCVSFVRVE